MKKMLTALLLATALVTSSTLALAATPAAGVAKVKKPVIKGAAGTEGTATHEMSETPGTQSKEGSGAKKKHVKKHVKKAAKKAKM